MKRLFLIPCICTTLLISCTSKKTATTTAATTENTTQAPDTEENPLKKFDQKVNQITEQYSGSPMNSIARSEIKETPSGYEWKVMNVKSGKKYIITTDKDFGSVAIKQNR
ncbi:hypothetical protein HN014_09025 [Aquimarina sp. TRL1]|uniref:hypothetical protein n=1 Tax=Aquimarina sp. (strain TRL1) TaxID=2736252 RepID=UPI0015898FF7|nr:hypothetical protein [Aquimarina sp. TRL1]QKX05053.1 hypothetical protein HN014_09025 [Aquimarina sp. TRL1]